MADPTKKYRTQDQVFAMFRRRGLAPRQAKIGSAIAMIEAPVEDPPGDEPMSDFGAIGDQHLADTKWGFSYGGLMIRSLRSQKGTGEFRDEERLLNPAFNVDSAVTIFRASHWQPWSTFTSGQYKAYLQDLFPPPAFCHIVLANQFLSTIAEMYDTTWQELARINNIHDASKIYIGQQIFYKEV